MEINKKQFETLLLFYAANIDGQQHPKELKIISKKLENDEFDQIKALFDGIGDSEILDIILDNKEKYAATPDDKQKLLNNIKSVIEADNELTNIEKYLYRNIEKLLNK